MNKIPTFKFPHDSLDETSLFENDFIWPKLFWKCLENSQEKVRGLQPLALKQNLLTGVFLVNFLIIF